MSLTTCQARCDALAAKAKPMSDTELQKLQQRNAERASAAIQKLGVRYVCHRANLVQRQPPKPDPRDMLMITTMLSRVFAPHLGFPT